VVAADEKNIAVIEHHKRALEKKRKEQRAANADLAKKLEAHTVTLARKVGEGEKLFGSVTTADIADVLKKAGFAVERRYVTLEQPIKTLGSFEATVKLDADTSATVKVVVTKED
jgi:large subunit ribosomal protein L9